MATRTLTLEVEGRSVVITNPDKVFFPRTGHTKLDLVNYYLAVADGAIKGVDGRPMAMKRFVNGAESTPFFQKRAPENRPPWIETAELSYPSGRTADEVVVRGAAQLAWVINLGCIDLNPHPVRADDVDHPDELRVDLDPVRGVPWPHVREVALVTRAVLEDFGLVGWPKTSGSRGFHVYCRIERRWTFPQVRRAAIAPAPLVEIARAATQSEAMAGLERWRARHPSVWPLLEPNDVLVDSMRGRNTTWTRIRVNLQHVPEEERPCQEPLEVDYDPWHA